MKWAIAFASLQLFRTLAIYTNSRKWAEGINCIGGPFLATTVLLVSSPKKQICNFGQVTGPNEYDNNVNNNWYTNSDLAKWCIKLCASSKFRK